MAYQTISPQDDNDYAFDWTDFLDEVGSPDDAIVSSVWRIVPDEGSPGAELHGDTFETIVDPDTGLGVVTSKVFVRGCTRGRVYLILNKVTTTQGREKEKSITLICEGEA